MGDAECKQAAGARSKISRKAREKLIFLGPEFFVPLCHDWYAEKKKPDRGPYSRKLNRLRARNLPIRNIIWPAEILKKKSLCNLSNDSMYQYCSLSAQWFVNNNFPVQTYQVSGL